MAEAINESTSQIRNFYSFTLEGLEAYLKQYGKEKFRAQQIFKWVYEQRVTDFDLMLNLSKDLRAELKNLITFELPPILKHLISVDGTQKFLFDVRDGNSIEAVVIPSDDRLTLCVSSEIGCNMACHFCFTGKQKLKRRLEISEIVGQFMQVQDVIGQKGLKLSNIVFMGMGEPLDNPEAVFGAIDVIHSPWGVNLSRKKITVSTSGLIPEMYRVSEAKVRLAVSLNGYNDDVRSQIMPINKKYPLRDLLNECKRYYRATGDKITMEYVLLKGITDQISHAHELVKLLRDVPCKINLIPFNEHPGSGFERPSDETVQAFHTECMGLGAQVLLRRTMGRDIFAACGQLTTKVDRPESMDISNSKIGGVNVRSFSSGQPRV
ncbi:MAG: 23S rRNA (adenine(2503)-C(2))-methyltransferase [Bdellovibrionales bacterium RIFCSPHIGHO2_01_FULL_40_29]|nr:MAG: 23S rRNA (adenine(2503)-C(2))-methyltransferase [Bdellovibrionales bacterium RIFCSPHIGHO2_01_FULL_40_29]OFZ35513.1 MAG: 23S rRNA (adenine(2503)-C(2))-methyltransferase [Bdellovibrionales bacterium RIFCSPHIGHO2_02_FULL_40_15]